jgi:hypothetical protein
MRLKRCVMTISTISLLQEIPPNKIAHRHSQTFKLHNYQQPILGIGQGSTKASIRWSFLSNALMYSTTMQQIKMPNCGELKINKKRGGFVDVTATMLFRDPDLCVYLLLTTIIRDFYM